MDIRRATPVLAALAILATPAISQAKLPKNEDPWLLLNKITHKRTYTFETRDGKCVWGTIKAVTADHLTARVSPWGSSDWGLVTFSRAEIVHVLAGWNAGGIYYSGRSSWADTAAFAALRVRGRERLRIVEKSSKTYDFKRPYTVSDDTIASTVSGKQVKVLKKEIARIYGIDEKPVTDNQGYALEELGPFLIFDPYFYEYGFHLERYVSVLLYDASRPEDNSPAACEIEFQRLRRNQVPRSAPEDRPLTPGVSPLP